MSESDKPVRPKPLRPGSTLAIVSPASTPKPELVAQGISALERMGYHAKLSPHALTRGPLYYAGSLEDRVEDLHAAFADPSIDGIVCTRGGWGSAELLPHLDRALMRAHPKAFLGYSDHTSLHLWLRNEINLVSFHAPMVAADFSKEGGIHLASWQSALSEEDSWTLGANSGLRTLRPGVAEGELSGGCLALYAEAIGTPYQPQVRGGILFLEDIGVKPYQWDRMLLHLRYAGLLEGVEGIVFGDMQGCCAQDEQPLMEAALLHALHHFTGPIGIGLRSGHVASGNITLPLGVQVRLNLGDAGNPRMHFLEAAVSG